MEMVEVARHLVVHALALTGSLLLGAAFTGWLLRRLRLVNADLSGTGTYGAGRVIGYAERLLIYLAVAGGKPELLAVLVAIKTWVRYPEVRRAAERAQGEKAAAACSKAATADPTDDPPPETRFAEYYLVGTLVSVCTGVIFPLAARAILGLFREP
jgi:hypothetical protein